MRALAVIGLGYIGLPTAVVLAQRGWDVTGVDVSHKAVDAINAGRLHFVEDGLEEALAEVVAAGRLRAQRETPHAEVYIVAVPTPFTGDHEADLRYIEEAADGIAPQLVGDELVILESTSPPGATAHMAGRILAARPDLSLDGSDGRPVVHFAHAPERVLPGRIMVEMVTNDRIVGGLTDAATARAVEVYKSFCEGEVHTTNARTAELAKLTENSYRDVNIAFANELSLIAAGLDIDVWELIRLANKHPRVNILQPGPGVGGHCIAVDPWFIVAADRANANLIRTAREVNDAKPGYVLGKVYEAVEGREGATVGALGLAFKPDIDDLRESPALSIVRTLASERPDLTVLAVEPNVSELPESLVSVGVSLVGIDEAIDRADVVVLLVDHRQFVALERSRFGETPVIDTRGVWN